MAVSEVEVHVKHYDEKRSHELPVELRMLTLLHPYHGFPKVLEVVEGEWIKMTDCGHEIDHALRMGMTSLSIIRGQLQGLLAVLRFPLGIRHRDISKHNLLWHPTGGLHLIDFGWAIREGEPNEPPPTFNDYGWWFCDMTDEERALVALYELEHDVDISNDRKFVEANFVGKGLSW